MSVVVVVVAVQDKKTCIVKHITMSDVHFAFFPPYTFTGPKIVPPLDACRATMNFAVCMSQQTILEELFLSKKERN